MDLHELNRASHRLGRARATLGYLDDTTAMEVELMASDDGYLGASARIEDPATVEAIKAHIRAAQGKIVADAIALLTAHGIDIPPENEVEDDEEVEAA
jgi:hypothetical protein